MTAPPSVATALIHAAATLPLDAKRRPSPKGMAAWYPYYAGFSDAFATHVMTAVPLRPGSIIVDPWNGAGTTTRAADRLGHHATGFDLNPVVTLVASAKLARPDDAAHLTGSARRISEEARRGVIEADGDGLHGWLPPSGVAEYRAIERSILRDFATDSSQVVKAPFSEALPPLASFLVLALLRAARRGAAIRTRTNPTWISPAQCNEVGDANLGAHWCEMVNLMAADLAADLDGSSLTRTRVQIGDARRLPTEDGSVDFVLTSPPYCTRIDYVVSTSFELAALGVGRDTKTFANLRRECMGTPLARSGLPAPPKQAWPASVRTLLKSIQAHPSKASHSYYYKTYWQYFDDCDRSLRELFRTLRPGGAAVLVVQSSYYKDLLVDLPQLYVDLGKALGFSGMVVGTTPVRRALAQINSRSTQHRQTTAYYESVVTLEKPDDRPL